MLTSSGSRVLKSSTPKCSERATKRKEFNVTEKTRKGAKLDDRGGKRIPKTGGEGIPKTGRGMLDANQCTSNCKSTTTSTILSNLEFSKT